MSNAEELEVIRSSLPEIRFMITGRSCSNQATMATLTVPQGIKLEDLMANFHLIIEAYHKQDTTDITVKVDVV